MELKDRVCSLDLAERLCVLGEPQDSYWWWDFWDGNLHEVTPSTKVKGWFISNKKGIYAAYTVAELGERLPSGFRSGKMEHGLFKGYNKNPQFQPKDGEIRDRTEANVRAKMRTYLLENKLVKQ